LRSRFIGEKAVTKKGGTMRRLIILLCGALLALMVVTPAVSARSPSGQSADPAELAAGWWKWALKKPNQVSPLLGDYSWKGQSRGAAKCAGEVGLGYSTLPESSP
jgi:hypothetical protein